MTTTGPVVVELSDPAGPTAGDAAVLARMGRRLAAFGRVLVVEGPHAVRHATRGGVVAAAARRSPANSASRRRRVGRRSDARDRRRSGSPMTAGIVVGVDDSEGARATLRWALLEGARRHVTVTVLHAYHLDIAWIDRGDIERWTTMEQHSAEVTLGHVLEDVTAPPGVDLEACVVDGLPAEVLIAASETAALLVVGARGRGGLTGLLFGSVSQRCVERARCPVVVVPTPHEVARATSWDPPPWARRRGERPRERRSLHSGAVSDATRVFLLDDHEVVRRGLRDLLEAEDDLVVTGEAGTAEEALRRIPATRPTSRCWTSACRTATVSRCAARFAPATRRSGA